MELIEIIVVDGTHQNIVTVVSVVILIVVETRILQ